MATSSFVLGPVSYALYLHLTPQAAKLFLANSGVRTNVIRRKTDARNRADLAEEEGCKFYLGSDAHHPAGLETITDRLGLVTSLLDLTAIDQYTIP